MNDQTSGQRSCRYQIIITHRLRAFLYEHLLFDTAADWLRSVMLPFRGLGCASHALTLTFYGRRRLTRSVSYSTLLSLKTLHDGLMHSALVPVVSILTLNKIDISGARY
jgi:hypothetical protein